MDVYDGSKPLTYVFRAVIFGCLALSIVTIVKLVSWIMAVANEGSDAEDLLIYSQLGNARTSFVLFEALCFATALCLIMSIFGRYGSRPGSIVARTFFIGTLLVAQLKCLGTVRAFVELCNLSLKAGDMDIENLSIKKLGELGVTSEHIDALIEKVGDGEDIVIMMAALGTGALLFLVLSFTSIYNIVMIQAYDKAAQSIKDLNGGFVNVQGGYTSSYDPTKNSYQGYDNYTDQNGQSGYSPNDGKDIYYEDGSSDHYI